MSYYMNNMGSKIKFKDGKDEEILSTIKEEVNEEVVSCGVDEIAVENSTTFQEALAACRWEYDEESQSIWFKERKLRDDYELFCAIAPFVEDGSYIEMIGEDGAKWRWVFKDGECHEIQPKIVWEV